MRRMIARWLGFCGDLQTFHEYRSRAIGSELNYQIAKDTSARIQENLDRETRRADAATSLLASARRERDQWERVAAACEQTLADMSADDRRVEALIRKARHTININPKGAQAHLDQAVRILRGEA